MTDHAAIAKQCAHYDDGGSEPEEGMFSGGTPRGLINTRNWGGTAPKRCTLCPERGVGGETNDAPPPRADREAIARVIEDIACRWIYRTAHNGPDHLCSGIGNEAASAVLALGVLHPSREEEQGVPPEPTFETFQDGINAGFDMALDTAARANDRREEFVPSMSRENTRDMLWAVISLFAARAGSYGAGYAIMRVNQLWHGDDPPLSALAEAERALEPFAEIAKHAKGKPDDCWCGQYPAVIRYSDLSRAASALTALRAIPAQQGEKP